MNSEPLYLHSRVKMEPLVNLWYAWSFLLSPITFAMVSKNLHLRVLESYLRSPKQHAKAAQNKALRGGLFVDHKGSIDEVMELVDFTKQNLNDLLELAEDIESFSIWLNEHANGGPLCDLYRDLPESLKGKVELVYDLHNRANIRFIENLYYNSLYYKPELQSISLSMLSNDRRPFVLSSPRFANNECVNIKRAFNDVALDKLFGMRCTPVHLNEVKEIVCWSDHAQHEQALLSDFFTEKPPACDYKRLDKDKQARIKYFGHATVLIESHDISILTDPIISYDTEVGLKRFSYKDLPDVIDYVVITHNHQDHVMLETLLQLRHKIACIVVPKNSGGFLQDISLKIMLQQIGFKKVLELDEMESIGFPGGTITGIPFLGEHGDLSVMSKLAFHVKLHNMTAIFAADSNNIDPALYANIHSIIGNIDYIFIGMECSGAPQSWLYGPLYSVPLERKHDEQRRLDGSNCDKALRLIRQFNPKAVYIYAMGAEPWLTFISSIEYTEESIPIIESNKLLKKCEELNIQAERLYGQKEINIGDET